MLLPINTDNHHEVKVAILMATYNGSTWLKQQIESILNQARVEITLFASDDLSQDSTYQFLLKEMMHDSRIRLLSQTHKFGSAGKNFYRLIQNVDIAGFDYIAFADQDDIWADDKLIRHVNLLRKYGSEAVSSNVIAFWLNGKNKLIKKSQPQRELDYLFESAGPGCTFLMTPWLVNKVREQLNDDKSAARAVTLHDWLTYAVCRAHGRKWIIDERASIEYRQHENNVVGANSGLKAKWVRLQKLRQGWYRNEVIKIVQICNGISPNIETEKLGTLLATKNLFSQLKLLAYVTKARRSLLDRCLLALSIAVGIF